MPHLSAGNYPIIADTTKIGYTHPFSKWSCNFAQTQVSIVPAYAVTAHQAQGQSMEKVIVNLESCQGMEALYVMISRATSLEGLLILRPFQQKRITCTLSQDTCAEKARLTQLLLQTLIGFCDTDKCKQAQIALSTMWFDSFPIKSRFEPSNNWAEEPFSLLQRLQNQESQIYDTHPDEASSMTLNNHINDYASIESSEEFLISSGKIVIS